MKSKGQKNKITNYVVSPLQYEILLLLEDGNESIPGILAELATKKNIPANALSQAFFQSLKGLIEENYVSINNQYTRDNNTDSLKILDINTSNTDWHLVLVRSNSNQSLVFSISGNRSEKADIKRVVNMIYDFGLMVLDFNCESLLCDACSLVSTIELNDRGIEAIMGLLEDRN